MRVAGSQRELGRQPIRARLHHAVAGWIVATVLVVLAVFGPPLTGQSIAPLIELRHDILVMDREFERFSIRPAYAINSDGLGRAGSRNSRLRAKPGGGVA